MIRNNFKILIFLFATSGWKGRMRQLPTSFWCNNEPRIAVCPGSILTKTRFVSFGLHPEVNIFSNFSRQVKCSIRVLLSLSFSFSFWASRLPKTNGEQKLTYRALKGFAFKILLTTAPYLCDVKFEQEITCQSYNYNRENKICELNNRTKEARPENFISAPAWFYIRRLNDRGRYIYLDVSTVE